jgi:hypothetical protein
MTRLHRGMCGLHSAEGNPNLRLIQISNRTAPTKPLQTSTSFLRHRMTGHFESTDPNLPQTDELSPSGFPQKSCQVPVQRK